MISERTAILTPSPTLAITSKAKAMRQEGIDVISFAAGEPDFPTPPHIIAAAVKAMQDGDTRYNPVSGKKELRQALADHYAACYHWPVSFQEIILGIGAKQVLFDAIATLINPGDEVLLPAPYWVSFPQMIHFSGGVVVPLATTCDQHYLPTVEQMEAAVTARTKLIILNFPHNPTGVIPPRAYMEELAVFLRRHPQIFIISDETYEQLCYIDDYFPLLQVAPDLKERTMVVSSFSKAYAMTGWRLGYAYANQEVIAAMGRIAGNCTSGPTSFVQTAGLAALQGDQAPVATMRQAFLKRRDLMAGLLSEIPGITFHLPEGAFYFFINVTPYLKYLPSSEAIANYLLEKFQLALVPGGFFGLEGYLRLSFATSDEQITEGMRRLKNGLAALAGSTF